MNVILGFTQELVESIDSPSPEQKEALDIINQNRASILGLMNTIIEFADTQYNKDAAEISEIPVTEIIENYEKNLNEITGIRDIEFAYGKISSSLRFGIDKKKLVNLLNIIFRFIGRISSQKNCISLLTLLRVTVLISRSQTILVNLHHILLIRSNHCFWKNKIQKLLIFQN